jgi:hypothetical protein
MRTVITGTVFLHKSDPGLVLFLMPDANPDAVLHPIQSGLHNWDPTLIFTVLYMWVSSLFEI